MKERNIQNGIRIEAVKFGCILMRNNNGVLKDRTGAYITYGLGPGTSDLIGWTSVNDQAVFTAVEIKRPGKKPTDEQLAFLSRVQASGGIACSATCLEDLHTAVLQYRMKH